MTMPVVYSACIFPTIIMTILMVSMMIMDDDDDDDGDDDNNNNNWVDPKKFRRVCMEFSNHNATISKTICPEMLIFGK